MGRRVGRRVVTVTLSFCSSLLTLFPPRHLEITTAAKAEHKGGGAGGCTQREVGAAADCWRGGVGRVGS